MVAMTVVPAPPGPTHELPGTRFTSLATPSRGSAETAVWTVEIDPGTPVTPHSLTREEVFVVLDGVADVSVDGRRGSARPGDAVVVPAGVDFEIGNAGTGQLRMLCCMPVGGQARTAEATFTPPWAR
jgi:mannose-6-phosphate isomerase-like protein (cupin superfamily)